MPKPPPLNIRDDRTDAEKERDGDLGKPTDRALEWMPAEPTVMQMLDRAVQSGQSIEYLKELIALKGILDGQALEAEQRAAAKAYEAAMIEAKHQLPTSIARTGLASFDTQRGATSYTYATLDDILQETVPTLAANALRHRFDVNQSAEQVTVMCILTHKDGHFETLSMSGPYDRSGSKNAIQALGSTTTYLKKYTYLGLLGIAAGEDDDAKLADAAARAPKAGPDAMDHPNAPKPQQQEPAPALDPEARDRLIEAARINAKQGEDVFRSFYVPLNKQQRDVLTPLSQELRKLINEADDAKPKT